MDKNLINQIIKAFEGSEKYKVRVYPNNVQVCWIRHSKHTNEEVYETLTTFDENHFNRDYIIKKLQSYRKTYCVAHGHNKKRYTELCDTLLHAIDRVVKIASVLEEI